MDHTQIVSASDLDRYADTRASEEVIPELLYWLVRQASNPSVCRIPYGDTVNQPGGDGIVETDEAFLEFVPEGKSYWEIGTGKGAQAKATEVFRNRMDLPIEDRARASFVFVTPRFREWSEPSQTRWLRRREDRGWSRIRIIDGVKLADWLREFPAVGQWMAKKIGLSPSLGGLSTPWDHWENIRAMATSSDPPLPPKLFTEGRENACNALRRLFEGTLQQLLLFAESPNDVADFVAAYMETLEEETGRNYAYRCLYVSEEDAWRGVAETRKSHVLVADVRLGLETPEQADLQTLAVRKGHAVVVPICGVWSEKSHETIRLRSPSRVQTETILKEAGFPDVRAAELAGLGGISAIRRNLQGLGMLPPYATWETARLIAEAGLAGKWEGKNPGDRAALTQLLGKEYGEWIEKLRPDALRSDSPLTQLDEKWRFVARGEAWSALGNRIADEDLKRLQETAIVVLGERDPMFDLPKEERLAASIHGKELKHSRFLREGLAETLALIGSRSEAISECSLHEAQLTAIRTVRRLLDSADWDVWASLGSLLPLVAEAAPDEFLSAVESGLKDLEHSPFHELFAQEGSGVEGWNHMSGLLWALEALAWNPELLPQVAIVLADLASIDPGGSWANRPFNSLVDIFLPWHVQTCAPPEMRRAAVEAVLHEQPRVGWVLILGLLPHSHSTTSGCHRPIWRDYIRRDWKDGVSRAEYWSQVTAYTELAIGLARRDTEKLGALVDRISDLPAEAHRSLLEHLASTEVVGLPEDRRVVVWEKLDSLVRQHRRFADADWAMPEDAVARIAQVARLLVPESPELKYRHLFSGQDFDLLDEEGDWREQQSRLDESREEALEEILERGDLADVMSFGESVAAPFEVGRALGNVANEAIEGEVLPGFLEVEDDITGRVVAGFVRGRLASWKWKWVDQVLVKDWTPELKSSFLALLPFEERVWKRVEHHLGAESEGLYWLEASVNPYEPNEDLRIAIEKLIQFERAPEAVFCVYRTIPEDRAFSEGLAIQALLALLNTPNRGDQLDPRTIVEVIGQLQQSPCVDSDALFKIEWCFLPLLGRFSSGSPVTLERRLATDPAFFGQVIALVFRGKGEDPGADHASTEMDQLAPNAYKLLNEWRVCPGRLPDGGFDADALKEWLGEVDRITSESGHREVAWGQIGQVLSYAPADPDGLWIHQAVASTLNARDADEMRRGFTIRLFNRRGGYWGTDGQEERRLAAKYRQRADALVERGYVRFAAEIRRFAESYEREAELEARSEE